MELDEPDWLLRRLVPADHPSIASSLGNFQQLAASQQSRGRRERLPDHGAFDKRPLQRIVQLVKYERDSYYAAADTRRPSSILLTTIVAQAYAELVGKGYTSLKEFILEVMKRFPAYIQISSGEAAYRFHVPNPVNPVENFADRWTVEIYTEFIEWHSSLVNRLTRFIHAKPEGLDRGIAMLENSFPQSKALDLGGKIGKEMRALHDSGHLLVKSAPAILNLSVPVPPTIYYGSKQQ